MIFSGEDITCAGVVGDLLLDVLEESKGRHLLHILRLPPVDDARVNSPFLDHNVDADVVGGARAKGLLSLRNAFRVPQHLDHLLVGDGP